MRVMPHRKKQRQDLNPAFNDLKALNHYTLKKKKNPSGIMLLKTRQSQRGGTLIPTPAKQAASNYPQLSLSLASHVETAQQAKAERKCDNMAKQLKEGIRIPNSGVQAPVLPLVSDVTLSSSLPGIQ